MESAKEKGVACLWWVNSFLLSTFHFLLKQRRPNVLTSQLLVNPVNWTGGLGAGSDRRLNECGVDDACCEIGLGLTRSS